MRRDWFACSCSLQHRQFCGDANLLMLTVVDHARRWPRAAVPAVAIVVVAMVAAIPSVVTLLRPGFAVAFPCIAGIIVIHAPYSLFCAPVPRREASHVAGFAKECAVVTHSRLHMGANGAATPPPHPKLRSQDDLAR